MVSKAFVIGNGFDLSLGMKTSYNDFIASDRFQKRLNSGASLLYVHLHSVKSLKRWVDVEAELANYSKAINGKSGAEDTFLSEFRILTEDLSAYLRDCEVRLNRNSHAYKLIEQRANATSEFYTFNYTTALSDVIVDLMTINTARSNIKHIHGDLRSQGIIVGVDDIATISPSHSFIRKSSHPYFGQYATTTGLLNAHEVYFFGHSLGPMDESHFTEFFHHCAAPSPARRRLYFFHHGAESKHSLDDRLYALTGGKVAAMKRRHQVMYFDTLNGYDLSNIDRQ